MWRRGFDSARQDIVCREKAKLRRRDEVAQALREAFPNGRMECNPGPGKPPIGAFEVTLRFGAQVSTPLPHRVRPRR